MGYSSIWYLPSWMSLILWTPISYCLPLVSCSTHRYSQSLNSVSERKAQTSKNFFVFKLERQSNRDPHQHNCRCYSLVISEYKLEMTVLTSTALARPENYESPSRWEPSQSRGFQAKPGGNITTGESHLTQIAPIQDTAAKLQEGQEISVVSRVHKHTFTLSSL